MIGEIFPADILDHRLTIVVLAALVASLMRGFAGFGSAMLLSPIYAILYTPADMVVLITLMELVLGLQLLPAVFRQVQWRFVGTLSGAALIFMPLGAIVLVRVDPERLTKVIAAVVAAFVVFMMFGWRYHGAKRLPTTLAVGAVSGTLMAITSMGGPPVLAYMLSGADRAATNRANIIGYYAVVEIGLLVVIVLLGLVAPWHAGVALIALPTYVLGGAIGARFFRSSDEKLYRRVALGFLLAVAAYGVLR